MAKSLSKQISKLFQDITVSPIRLLEEDTKRKRFIDSITSVVSRSYYRKSSEKFTDTPSKIIFQSNYNRSIRLYITQKETSFMNKMLKAYLL
jgi:hypothetical protein